MAECQCNVTNGMLSPGVFNIKQFLNDTQEMRWTVSSRQLPGGIDLANYDAFLVLQHGTTGEPDEVMLIKTVNDDGTITLIWNVGKYATWLKGYVKYQIVFRGGIVSELSVLKAGNEDASGVFGLIDQVAEGTSRKWVHKTKEEYTIEYNFEENIWQVLKYGSVVISSQTMPHEEPHYGLWDNAYVGNVSAMAWRSLEAVMYISESIAADELVSAKCPTILRQMWYSIRDMIVRSGVNIHEASVMTSSWTESAGCYVIDSVDVASNIPANCNVVGVQVLERQSDGSYSEIGNTKFTQGYSGSVHVYSPSPIAGKILFMIKGGNGYSFVADNAVGGGSGGVTSINGKTGIVTLTAEDLGAASADVINAMQKAINEMNEDLTEVKELVGMAVTELEGI